MFSLLLDISISLSWKYRIPPSKRHCLRNQGIKDGIFAGIKSSLVHIRANNTSTNVRSVHAHRPDHGYLIGNQKRRSDICKRAEGQHTSLQRGISFHPKKHTRTIPHSLPRSRKYNSLIQNPGRGKGDFSLLPIRNRQKKTQHQLRTRSSHPAHEKIHTTPGMDYFRYLSGGDDFTARNLRRRCRRTHANNEPLTNIVYRDERVPLEGRGLQLLLHHLRTVVLG